MRVCNPISIAKALETKTIQSYWVRTATASLVMERLMQTGMRSDYLEGCEASAEVLDVCDALELLVKALDDQGRRADDGKMLRLILL